MAVEDVEWQERYGDQSYKAHSLRAIRVALLAIFFSQAVVLPSLAVYLSTLHASLNMLGYCLAATCLGELCANNFFSMCYDQRPAREVVVGALILNVIASLLYAAAPHRFFVLASRFVVGLSSGVQAPLMTMVGAFTNRYDRPEILGSMRSMYVLAFVLGAGVSTSVTFVHMYNPGLPLDAMQHSVPTYVSQGKAAVRREADAASKVAHRAIDKAADAASRTIEGGDHNADLAARGAFPWDAPFQLWGVEAANNAAKEWEKDLLTWGRGTEQGLAVPNQTAASLLHDISASFALPSRVPSAHPAFVGVAGVGSARPSSKRDAVSHVKAALSLAGRRPEPRPNQPEPAAARAAVSMEHVVRREEQKQGRSTQSRGTSLPSASWSQARDGQGTTEAEVGGLAAKVSEAMMHEIDAASAVARQAVGKVAAEGISGGIAAVLADVGKTERRAVEALRQEGQKQFATQSKETGAGGSEWPADDHGDRDWPSETAMGQQSDGGLLAAQGDSRSPVFAYETPAWKRSYGGQRRLLAVRGWGFGQWVDEATQDLADAEEALEGVQNASDVHGGDDLETDAEIETKIGSHDYYLPAYFTAIVGHGLRAPGYLAAVASLLAAVYVWVVLVEGPRKVPTRRVPLSHLSPHSMAYFYPLIACVALEFVAQLALVGIEVMVPPLLRLWRGWSCDAIAVFMMCVAACGVVGLAVLDPLKKRQPLRRLLFWAALLVLVGFSQCIAWRGHGIGAWQYGLGCCLCALGFLPLSSIANDIVSAAVVKMYSEDGELMWLELFWGLTRIPARVAGPLLLVYTLETDPSGSLGYVVMAVLAAVAIVILFLLRTSLITPGTATVAEVLPGATARASDVPMGGGGGGDVRYGPLVAD